MKGVLRSPNCFKDMIKASEKQEFQICIGVGAMIFKQNLTDCFQESQILIQLPADFEAKSVRPQDYSHYDQTTA